MSLNHTIYAWLDTLSDGYDYNKPETPQSHEDKEPLRKRRRFNPPTPKTSQTSRTTGRRVDSSYRQPSLNKRELSKEGDFGNESQETPHPHHRQLKPPRSESSCSLASPSTTGSTKSSSLIKQISTLERSSRGVVSRELSTFQPQPESLESLLERVDLISAGQGILPLSERESFDRLDKETYHNWKWTQRGLVNNMYFSEFRYKLGATPPAKTVHNILYQAAFCNSRGSSESD